MNVEYEIVIQFHRMNNGMTFDANCTASELVGAIMSLTELASEKSGIAYNDILDDLKRPEVLR